MKVSWISWWIVTGVEVLIFIALAAFLWMREVDGSGAVQTPEIKMVNIIVLAVFYLIPVAIQVVWLMINLVKGGRKEAV